MIQCQRYRLPQVTQCLQAEDFGFSMAHIRSEIVKRRPWGALEVRSHVCLGYSICQFGNRCLTVWSGTRCGGSDTRNKVAETLSEKTSGAELHAKRRWPWNICTIRHTCIQASTSGAKHMLDRGLNVKHTSIQYNTIWHIRHKLRRTENVNWPEALELNEGSGKFVVMALLPTAPAREPVAFRVHIIHIISMSALIC